MVVSELGGHVGPHLRLIFRLVLLRPRFSFSLRLGGFLLPLCQHVLLSQYFYCCFIVVGPANSGWLVENPVAMRRPEDTCGSSLWDIATYGWLAIALEIVFVWTPFRSLERCSFCCE